MGYHLTELHGRVDKTTGNSTEHPISGSGSAASWDLFTEGASTEKHIPFMFERHYISVSVYSDESMTKVTKPTAGKIVFKVTDNGMDWGTVKPAEIDFSKPDYDRISFCGPVCNVQATITGLRPNQAEDSGHHGEHGVFVVINIHSYN